MTELEAPLKKTEAEIYADEATYGLTAVARIYVREGILMGWSEKTNREFLRGLDRTDDDLRTFGKGAGTK